MTAPGEFGGRVALVTGAGSGIGEASALAFGRLGARVVACDVREDAAERTAQAVRDAGGEARHVAADVSVDADVRSAVGAAVQWHGSLDIAHNNAGIFSAYAPIDDFPEESWDATMAVNAKGVWLCLKHELAQMRRQGSGVVVNTASVVSSVAQANVSAYVASKHAVLGLTRTAAIEAASYGVRVNAVCPGFVRTPAVAGHEEVIAQLVQRVPLRRQAESGEVADAVTYLCSDRAAFVTGHGLVIDGALSVAPID